MDKKKKEIIEPFGFKGGQLLQDILEKGPSSVSPGEREILMGRRDYLTNSQKSDFDISDEVEVEAETEVEVEEIEVEEVDSDPVDVESNVDEDMVDLSTLTNKELRKVAKEMKVDIKGLQKNADIIKVIKKESK